MLDAARLVLRFVEGVDRTEFADDVMRQSAVARQIEVMGEATKQLSVEFREAHSTVPWKRIAGMRDVLIHAYRSVDVLELWRVATDALPALESIASAMPEGGAE